MIIKKFVGVVVSIVTLFQFFSVVAYADVTPEAFPDLSQPTEGWIRYTFRGWDFVASVPIRGFIRKEQKLSFGKAVTWEQTAHNVQYLLGAVLFDDTTRQTRMNTEEGKKRFLVGDVDGFFQNISKNFAIRSKKLIHDFIVDGNPGQEYTLSLKKKNGELLEMRTEFFVNHNYQYTFTLLGTANGVDTAASKFFDSIKISGHSLAQTVNEKKQEAVHSGFIPGPLSQYCQQVQNQIREHFQSLQLPKVAVIDFLVDAQGNIQDTRRSSFFELPQSDFDLLQNALKQLKKVDAPPTGIQSPLWLEAIINAPPGRTFVGIGTIDWEAYINSVDAKLQKKWHPPTAEHTTLTTAVRLRVLNNGQIKDLEVSKSSGESALDDLALEAVRKAVPFPPFPDGGPEEIAIQLILERKVSVLEYSHELQFSADVPAGGKILTGKEPLTIGTGHSFVVTVAGIRYVMVVVQFNDAFSQTMNTLQAKESYLVQAVDSCFNGVNKELPITSTKLTRESAKDNNLIKEYTVVISASNGEPLGLRAVFLVNQNYGYDFFALGPDDEIEKPANDFISSIKIAGQPLIQR